MGGSYNSEREWGEFLMANYLTTDTELTSVANAIRTKGGTSASLSYPSGFVSAIQNIPTGGSSVDEDSDVLFIDYDGTPVAGKSKSEINAMTSDSDLPANPTHTGLTAQGWNWTVAQLKAQLLAEPDQQVIVGQMYVTTSGATEIDVKMQAGRLNPQLTMSVKGTVSVDWGDGTTPENVAGTSLTTRIFTPHTYATEGEYTISITKISGEYTFYGNSSSNSNATLLRVSTYFDENRVYVSCVRNIRIGTGISKLSNYAFVHCVNVSYITIPSSITNISTGAFNTCGASSITIPSSITSIENSMFYTARRLGKIALPSGVTSIGTYAFYGCNALLDKVTIPSGVTSIGEGAFSSCYALGKVTIPSNVTTINNSVFSGCNSLNKVTIPSGVTSIGTYAFYTCDALTEITIPSNVTSIGTYAFYRCYSLVKITIPSGVTNIESNTFNSCKGLSEIHLMRTTPPSMSNTNAFGTLSSSCIIYVPYSEDHSILNAYKTASNWSTYASYMQEEPQ